MPRTSQYVEHVLEVLAPLGEVRARAMFGGWGVYCDGLMFALIADDTLHLKADDRSRGRFEDRGIGRFKPYADRPATMSYYEVPAELFDDRDALLSWAREACAVALRARTARPASRRPRSRAPGG